MIDVRKGKINLNIGGHTVNFNMKEVMKKPTIDGQTFSIDCMEELVKLISDELMTDDALQIALTKPAPDEGFLLHTTDEMATWLFSEEYRGESEACAIQTLPTLKKKPAMTLDWKTEKAPKVYLKPYQKG